MRSGAVPCPLLNRHSWVSSGRTQSRIRVEAYVHSASPSKDRKAYLGSWDMSVCLPCRVSSLGLRGASQSVVVFSNVVLGVVTSDNPVLGSWALRNVISEGETSRGEVRSPSISSVENWG